MDAAAFRTLFLILFSADALLDILLTALNAREARRRTVLPEAFRGHFDEETFSRSRAYSLDKLAFAKFSLAYSVVVNLFILFSGILPWADRWFRERLGEGAFSGAAFLLAIMLLHNALTLPFSIYSTFRIEGKYGFNTVTWGLYCRDLLKGVMLSLIIGYPLLSALLWVVESAGDFWWLWAFALIAVFQFAMMIVYPAFIAPLFNRFRPLEEGELKSALLGLAASLRFPARDIYVMDGSRRSLHSNAYFTGFGRFRRIVLFDTLLRHLETRELCGILAHETGHAKLHHLRNTLAVQLFFQAALLFLLSLALQWPPLFQAFGFQEPALAAGMLLFMAVVSTFSTWLSPIQNHFSRLHEYAADAFALRALRDGESLQSALIKLSRKNLSNLTPHPWYSLFHYSHPSLEERLKAISGAKISDFQPS